MEIVMSSALPRAAADMPAFLIIGMPCDKQILTVCCFDSCVVEEILILDLFKEMSFNTGIIQSPVAGCVAEDIHSRESLH